MPSDFCNDNESSTRMGDLLGSFHLGNQKQVLELVVAKKDNIGRTRGRML